MHIGIVCGTNREGATSRLLAKETEAILRPLCSVDFIDMAELPIDALRADAYRSPSAGVKALVDRFVCTDGAVFIIPEYNGSFPGVLKVFVDMLPYPQGFDRRPCAYVGIAAGQFKGLRAVEHFQQIAGYRNAHHFPQRLFIGDSGNQFTDGHLKDTELAQRLTKIATEFLSFVRQIKSTA